MEQGDDRNPTAQARKASRRIPPDRRKRAALSCDFCKTRRRKCVRRPSSGGCDLCKQHAVECVSTIPRKQRASESTRDVTQRQALLESLVRKLFPTVNTEDTNELARLSESVDCNDGDFQGHSSERPKFGNAVEISSVVNGSLHDNITSHQSPTSGLIAPSDRPENLYEKLLRNSSGTNTYFGSSSSMAFVLKIREFLDLQTKQKSHLMTRRQRRLRDEFTTDIHSYTMDSPVNAQESEPISRPSSLRVVQSPIANIFQSKRLSRTRLLEVGSSKMELNSLVDIFFVHVHPNIVIFHRPVFQGKFEDLWNNDVSESLDISWITCFCVVLAFGCEWKVSLAENKGSPESGRLAKMQQDFITIAMDNIAQLMLSATLQSVQAFIVLAVYFNCVNERNASWVTVGCAVRIAISLGLHRGDMVIRGDIHLAPIERELRKRVWWSLYIFEQYSSALFGRPIAILETETSVDLPSESILDEGYYRPPGLLQHDVSLARILGQIRKAQVGQRISSEGTPRGLPDLGTSQQYLRQLETWQDGLPAFLKVDESSQSHIYPSHFRQILTLQLRYQYARLLLGRPFHLQKLHRTLFDPGDSRELRLELSNVCVNAALESWKIIRALWTNGQFDGNLWFDGVFVYQCAMVLCLTLLGATKRPGSIERKTLQDILGNILNILHQAPLNKTMNRFVQITEDLASIVHALESGTESRASPQASVHHPAHPAHRAQPGESVNAPATIDAELAGVSIPGILDPLNDVGSGFEQHGASASDFDFSNPSLYDWDLEGADVVGSLVNGDFPPFYAFGGL